MVAACSTRTIRRPHGIAFDVFQRGTTRGYVPNVTYSCGALIRDRRILLPYAIGDEYSAFAVGDVDDLLSAMTAD